MIPSARNLFDFTDPNGRLLRYFIEGPVDTEIARLYFEQFHNRAEAACMPAFATLRDAPSGVRGAQALCTPAFFRSALFNEVWRPQGMHTRIEGVVRDASGRLHGSLVLYRGPTDQAFTKNDQRTLAALLPAVAGALSGSSQAANDEPYLPCPEPTESLLVDSEGRVLQTSAGAPRLLMLADAGLSADAVAQPLQWRVQRLFGHLLSSLSRRSPAPVGPAAAWPSMTLVNAHGRFVAKATWLQPADRAGHSPMLALLSLRRLEPRRVAVQRVLRAMPVSPGQAAVCERLMRGRSHAEIARDLGVAPSTVIDHSRKLLHALGAASVADLRALIERHIGGHAH